MPTTPPFASPSFDTARWFFRERRDEGLWLPFSRFDSTFIESIYRRHKRNTFFLPGVAGREISVEQRRVRDVESGDERSLLRGTWFFARSGE